MDYHYSTFDMRKLRSHQGQALGRSQDSHVDEAIEEEENHGGIRITLGDSHDVQVVVLDVDVGSAY